MTTRRNLLAGILAAGMAPAVARSGVLMPVRPLKPTWYETLRSGIVLPHYEPMPSVGSLRFVRGAPQIVCFDGARWTPMRSHDHYLDFRKGLAC